MDKNKYGMAMNRCKIFSYFHKQIEKLEGNVVIEMYLKPSIYPRSTWPGGGPEED